MNTINIMCEAPLLKGNIPTTSVVDLNNPSPYPSLGSTRSLGSAPPEGGMSKYPGVLGDHELGGVWVEDEKHPWDYGDSRIVPLLRPENFGAWKLGSGSSLPVSNHSNHPTPYCPIPPTPSTPIPPRPSTPNPSTPIPPTPSTPNPPTPSTPLLPAPSTPQIHPTTPSTLGTPNPTSTIIKTATGGIKRLAKRQIKLPTPKSSYVCDGIGCSFVTNSPYTFIKHQSTPHKWKSGSQNWCFAKANALAQGRKHHGIKASGPTVFQSTDIRVKSGQLSPNVIYEAQVNKIVVMRAGEEGKELMYSDILGQKIQILLNSSFSRILNFENQFSVTKL